MSLMAELDEEYGIIDTLDIGGVLDPYRNTPHTEEKKVNPPAYMPSPGDAKSREAERAKKKKLASRRGRASTVNTPVSSGGTLG